MSAGSLRSIERRAVAAALAFALAAAPVLASLWPAFGKGPMLWTGEPAAERAAPVERAWPHVAPARHHHEDHANAGHDAAHDSVHVAAAHSDSASAGELDGSNLGGDAAAGAHHTQHCALCVLAFLGWAPPGAQLLVSPDRSVVARPDVPADIAPRASLIWDRAQARAPPVS